MFALSRPPAFRRVQLGADTNAHTQQPGRPRAMPLEDGSPPAVAICRCLDLLAVISDASPDEALVNRPIRRRSELSSQRPSGGPRPPTTRITATTAPDSPRSKQARPGAFLAAPCTLPRVHS